MFLYLWLCAVPTEVRGSVVIVRSWGDRWWEFPSCSPLQRWYTLWMTEPFPHCLVLLYSFEDFVPLNWIICLSVCKISDAFDEWISGVFKALSPFYLCLGFSNLHSVFSALFDLLSPTMFWRWRDVIDWSSSLSKQVFLDNAFLKNLYFQCHL